MLNDIKKYVPKSLMSAYHAALAIFAAVLYFFPSRKIIVIGVTGTNGKTTTCNMIAKVLEEAGYSVGLMTTANFKIKDQEWINKTKQTMQGRFRLQKFLRRMVKARCDYAMKICKEKQPPLFEISERHRAACWLCHKNAPKVESPIKGEE